MEKNENKVNDPVDVSPGNEKKHNFFTVISDFLDCLVVILDQQGKIVYYNKFCETVTGFSFEEVRNKYYWDVFCLPEEKELYKAFFEMLDVEKYPLELETQVTGKDDKVSTILWKYNVLQQHNEGELYHVLSGIDITNYDRANKELQKIGERYRTIIHVSPVAVISLDPDFKITSWSSAAENLLGWTEKDVLGKSIFLIFGNNNSGLEEACINTRKGKTTCDLELSCNRKDGSSVYVSLYTAPTHDYSGAVDGVVLIALDITERKNAVESLNYQLEVEKLTANVSSYFANLPAEHLHDGISDVLEMVGEFLQVDRGFVLKLSADYKTSSLSHEWHVEGNVPIKETLQSRQFKELPWWQEKLSSKNCFSFSDINSLPPRAEKEKQLFRSQNVQSMICMPLIKEGKLFGAVGYEKVLGKKKWTRDHKKLLTVIAELISNAFSRYLAHKEISYMSFHDQLTDLYNRHYLAEEMHRLDTSRQLPLSIIIADLNGLKLVNDIYGHIKGDELLKKTAEILKTSCREEDIIARWGGDEFLILLPKTSKQKAEMIQKRIMENCPHNYTGDVPISIALGVECKTEHDQDLQDIIRKAEDKMYEQKLSQSRNTTGSIISALRKALAEKSFEKEEHIQLVEEVSVKIGQKLGFAEIELNRLKLLANLHDIGNINIPKEILTKNGPLTAEEWAVVVKHPGIGFRIARATEELAHVAEEIMAHHEHYDGSGYPQGLEGKEIPLLSRIVAIADAYSVMKQGRPYRRKKNHEEIVAEFKKCSGTQFDPELVDIFITNLKNFGKNFGTQ